MLVEVDLSAIVADMEHHDGEEGDMGHHVGGGVGSDFMNMVRLLLSFLMVLFLVHLSKPVFFFEREREVLSARCQLITVVRVLIVLFGTAGDTKESLTNWQELTERSHFSSLRLG